MGMMGMALVEGDENIYPHPLPQIVSKSFCKIDRPGNTPFALSYPPSSTAQVPRAASLLLPVRDFLSIPIHGNTPIASLFSLDFQLLTHLF